MDKDQSDHHNNISRFQFQNLVEIAIFRGTTHPGEKLNISEESLIPKFMGTAEQTVPHPSRWVEAAVFLAAFLGHLPTLGAWWNQDDWGLLARAAGLIPGAGGLPARLISQHFYWDLTWPLFGLHPGPHSLLRMILHGLCALLITRLATKAGFGLAARLVAGLLVAATPLVFTPLYWAAGIQELLAAVFALAAVDRWLAGSRRDLFIGFLFALLSIFSKESALGLPLFLMALLMAKVGPSPSNRNLAWSLSRILLAFAILEGVLVLRHFATGLSEPYALGGPVTMARNLGLMGWWLLTPGPFLAASLVWQQLLAGALLFVLWVTWGTVLYRRGRPLPLLTFLAAMLCLAPALPLQRQLHPYLGYLALCAGALALSSLIPRHRNLSRQWLVGLSLLAAAWSYFSMETRLNQRDAAGLPADPVVRATSLSWQISRLLPQLPLRREGVSTGAVTFLQMPATEQQAVMADQLGERWVAGTYQHESIGGTLGPRLILGPGIKVDWVNALFSNPDQAVVLCENGPDLKNWGTTGNATLYAALADVAQGRFERARKHLNRAAALNDKTMTFAYDPDQMIVPVDQVLARKKEFIDWTVQLLAAHHSAREVAGLQDLFFNLLSACTGQSRTQLTAGTTILENQAKPLQEH